MRRSLWLMVTAAVFVLVAGCETAPSGKATTSAAAPRGAAALLAVHPGYDGVGPGKLEMLTPEQLGGFIQSQILMLTDLAVLETAILPVTAELLVTDLEPWERTARADEAVRARAKRIAAGKERLLGGGSVAEQAARLGELLKVRRAGNSTTIIVEFAGDGSPPAADLVNSVVDAYMLSCKDRRLRAHMRAVHTLQRQVNEVEARRSRARNVLETYLSEEGHTVRIGDSTDVQQRLALLLRARLEAEMAFIEASLARRLLEAEGEGKTVSPEMELQIQSDPVIAELTVTENELLVQKAALPQPAEGAAGPELATVLSRLAAVRDQKELRRADLLRLLAGRRQEAVDRSYALAEQNLRQIARECDRARAEAQQAARDRFRYEELRDEYDALRKEADRVQEAMMKLQMETDLERPRVLVLSAARPEPSP